MVTVVWPRMVRNGDIINEVTEPMSGWNEWKVAQTWDCRTDLENQQVQGAPPLPLSQFIELVEKE